VDQIRAWDNRRFLEKLEKLNPGKALGIRGKLGAVMVFQDFGQLLLAG